MGGIYFISLRSFSLIFSNSASSLLLLTTFVYVLAGLATSAVNTLLVIGLTSLFFMHDPASLLHNLGQDHNQAPLIAILLTVLGANGIAEAIFTGFVTPFIALPIKKYLLKRIN